MNDTTNEQLQSTGLIASKQLRPKPSVSHETSTHGKLRLLLLTALVLMPMVGFSQAPMIRVGSIEVNPSQSFALPIEGDWTGLISGYSFSIGFPVNAPIDNLVVDVAGTLVGSIEAEYVQEQVDSSQGTIICGVLFDALPPFDGQTLPSLGAPQEIAFLIGEVSATAQEQSILFTPVDGYGDPPINNILVFGTESVPVNDLQPGQIDVVPPPPPAPIFIRGDVNMDSNVDLADVIFHLDYTFLDGDLPICLDAGDANDDGISDISDAIFLLCYFFLDGEGPWVPFPSPGVDWTDDLLGCEQGL